jgi:hypothetical protein
MMSYNSCNHIATIVNGRDERAVIEVRHFRRVTFVASHLLTFDCRCHCQHLHFPQSRARCLLLLSARA